MKEFIKTHGALVRFLIVGAGNAVLDTGIYTILVHFSMNFFVANLISTTIAFCSSFYFNRSFSFRAENGSLVKQIITFTLATVVSLWGIQPLVIYFVGPVLPNMTIWFLDVRTIGAKLCGIAAGTVWNYLTYSRFVFGKDSEENNKVNNKENGKEEK